MKQTFKKLQAVLVAAVLAFCGFTTTAFAAEEQSAINVDMTEEHGSYEFDITPDMVDENGMVAISKGSIDQSWNFTHTHQGSNRTYSSSSISFSAKITDSNGNAVGDQISIDLKESNGVTHGHYTAYADGTWYGNNNIPIVSGDTYYFYYTNESSSSRTMKIRMIITW